MGFRVLLRLQRLRLLGVVSKQNAGKFTGKRSDGQLSAASLKLPVLACGNVGWSISDDSVHHNMKLQA